MAGEPAITVTRMAGAEPQFTAQLVDPAELKPHPRNPRKHDVERIMRSIRGTGWHSVVTVQRSTGNILVGHGRTEAAKRVIAALADGDPAWKEWAEANPNDPLVRGLIPVEYVDLDDGAALDKVLADNKASDEAGYDRDLVTQLLVERWAEDDLDATAWTEAEVAKMQSSPTDDIDTKPVLMDFEYRVVIRVADEQEQAEVLQRLTNEGLDVQALTS